MNLNDLFNEEKVRLDPKCWTGKKIGNPKTKMKGGVRVNNCVPAESVEETRRGQIPMTLNPGETDNLEPENLAGFRQLPAYKQGQAAQQKAGKQLIQKSPYTFQSDQDWAYRQGAFDAQQAAMNANFGKSKPLTTEETLDEKSVSQAQFRTMAGAAHNPEFAKKVGISQDVAQEFNRADKHSNYKKLPARATEENERGRGRPVAGEWDTSSGKVGRVEKTATGLRHHADPSRYGGTIPEPEHDKLLTPQERWRMDKITQPIDDMDEGEQQKGADYRDPKEVDYDDEYDAMVARVKKLAGLGPMKTVYDPAKRQYRNMPTADQPKR